MNKKILLLTLILIFSGLSAAQTVEIEDADEFPTDLTGGESFDLGLDYSVNVDREVPLALELEVSGEEGIPEEAFDVEANGDDYQSFSDGVYRVNLEDTSEDGSATLTVESSPRLKPGSYNFSLDLLSTVGVGDELQTEEVSATEPSEINGERSSVTVEASESGTANVTELDFVGVNPPSDNSEFIGGVEVNVADDDGNDIGSSSSGTVRVNFDEEDVEGLERDSLSVYFYNESSSGWEALDSRVGDGFVEADVDHFSVYSVYGEEEDTGGSGGSISIDSGSDDMDQDPVSNGSEDENVPDTDESEGEGSDDGQDESSDGSVDESGESETDEVDQGSDAQGFTGQFTETASDPVFVGSALLVLLLGGLVYSGRHEDILEKVKELDIR